VGGGWEEVKRRTKHQQRRFCRTFSLDFERDATRHTPKYISVYFGDAAAAAVGWMNGVNERGVRERERI
jgi:hypothetical protein